MSEKKTHSEMYAEMSALAAEAGREDLVEFCDKQIESLARKAEKARERAAEKAAQGDELKVLVAGALTDELQTGAAIFAAVEGEVDEVTIGKVRARLTTLVRDGGAVKEEIKNEEGHKVMAYRLA